MRLALVCGLALLFCGFAAADKKNAQQKPPEIELVEGNAKRQGGDILLDGKVKNCGEKPIKDLVIYFHFFDVDLRPLTTRKGGIDAAVLAPGEDAEFHVQMEQPPRATHYKIDFQDGGGKDLRPAKAPTPVAIE